MCQAKGFVPTRDVLSSQQTAGRNPFFSHPDFHCRQRSSTVSPRELGTAELRSLRAVTAGREYMIPLTGTILPSLEEKTFLHIIDTVYGAQCQLRLALCEAAVLYSWYWED